MNHCLVRLFEKLAPPEFAHMLTRRFVASRPKRLKLDLGLLVFFDVEIESIFLLVEIRTIPAKGFEGGFKLVRIIPWLRGVADEFFFGHSFCSSHGNETVHQSGRSNRLGVRLIAQIA